MFCVHSVPGNPYFRSDAFSLGINMHMLCKFQAWGPPKKFIPRFDSLFDGENVYGLQ